ncbi:hypothetical protein H4R24_004786 [Coemansia sp. RSA 988]|nr:hypothetical protein H4R24_004786 [Coemansia sp. RSA 988]
MALVSALQTRLNDVMPRGFLPRLYILAVFVLAAVFVVAESYILYITKEGHAVALNSIWQVPGIQRAVTTSITTYMVYNVLFILAQVYIIFLCIEALVHKDIIQIVVVVVFYFICLVFATTRYISFYVYPSVAARMFTRDSNMQLMQITVVVTYVLSLASLSVLSLKLAHEIGWDVFKRLGADIGLHRAYMWHQCLMMLLKMDIYFIGSYLVQMTALVLKVDDPETWLQITVVIPVCVILIVGGFVALHDERRGLMSFVSLSMFLSVGYFIYKIYRVCEPGTINMPNDPYADSRPFFMITIVVCVLLVISTGVASAMCIFSFDSGLKEAIAYDKMRTRHIKMYAVDKDITQEQEPLVPRSSTLARDRFALD